MPILKTDILGSKIEINYEDSEKEKLLNLIDIFKERLLEFPQSEKINDKTIIFFSALKIEDELQENKNLLSKNNIDKKIINDQAEIIIKLNKEITFLENKIEKLNDKNLIELNDNLSALDEIKNLEHLVELIQIKIRDELSK